MKGEEQKRGNTKKICQNQKYYKIKADFSYLQNFNYEITKQLGRGGYGVVYKAHHLSDPQKKFAIKINFNTVSRELIYTEMAFLQLVKGQTNLPRLHNLFVHNDITHIVIEYFKYKPFISFFNTFNMQEVKRYLYEMLKALNNLKKLGIYHRDVKPGNFLYNPETHVGMLIDFGLAEIDLEFQKAFESKIEKAKAQGKNVSQDEASLKIYKRLADCLKIIGKNKIGTETYMPLESILHHGNQNYQSDLWPVGVVFLQFVTRKYNIFNNVRMVNKPSNIKNPYYINYIMELANFYGQEVIDQCKALGYDLKLPTDLLKKLDFKDIARIDHFDENAYDLLKRLLALDATKRITVEDALKHPFFKSIMHEQEAKMREREMR